MTEVSKPHSGLFTEFALVREGLMEAGHPTGGARLAALDRIEEQLEAAQRENHEWNAAYGRLLQLLYRADAQLALENEKHPNHNITELRRDIASEAKKDA